MADNQKPGIPKDGVILNGCFWLDGESWLITDNQKTIIEHLSESLKEQREYIKRLTNRAEKLEKWLEKQTLVP